MHVVRARRPCEGGDAVPLSELRRGHPRTVCALPRPERAVPVPEVRLRRSL